MKFYALAIAALLAALAGTAYLLEGSGHPSIPAASPQDDSAFKTLKVQP